MEHTDTDGAGAGPHDAAADLQRLFENLPLGVIAVDMRRRILHCNQRAAAILKYDPADLASRPIEDIYHDPREPGRIGRQLSESPSGTIHNYETFVRSSDGESIPIRVTASRLSGERGERLGSVSYFEDLRPVKEGERRLSKLLKENNLISQIGKAEETLHIWAELMVLLLNATFCRIFLLDPTGQFLVAKAAHPVRRAAGRLEWEPGIGKRTAVGDWPRMQEFIKSGAAKVLRAERPGGQRLLDEWSQRLGLEKGLQSMLVVPLRTKDRLLGLVDFGELRGAGRASFSEEKKEFATAIINQIAVSLDHAHLTERHRQMLAMLIEKSLQLRSDLDSQTLLSRFVREATGLLGFKAGGLFTRDPLSKELALQVVYRLPEELLGGRVALGAGVAGSAALGRRPMLQRDYSAWGQRERLFDGLGFETAIAAPLHDGAELVGVIFLAADAAGPQVAEGDLEVLAQFAAHASLAWRTSRLVSSEQQRLAQLVNLSDMSGYIESSKDVDTIVRVLLTGITAGYALGFNRAAVLLLDESRAHLVGRAGVGYLKEIEAHQDWERLYHRGVDNFTEFLRLLEQEKLPPTPVDERIRGLRLPVRPGDGADLFSRAVAEKEHIILDNAADLAELPPAFRDVLDAGHPAIVVPLVAHDGEVLGVLFADTKFTQTPITGEVVESLHRFVATVARNLRNVALLEQTPARAAAFDQLWELTRGQAQPEPPRRVLQYVVEQMLAVADAAWVRLILIDPGGHKQSRNDWIAKARPDREIKPVSSVRPDGNSMKVIEGGKHFVVEDTEKESARVSETARAEGSRAFACLPFYVQGQIVGVVWFHYDAPRPFNSFEIRSWQSYLNFAAVLYADARHRERLDSLRRLHAAADALAATTTRPAVLDQIVSSARDVLRADYVIPWLYDPEQNQFFAQSSPVAPLPEELWEQWSRQIPQPGGTADSIMQAGWVAIRDVRDPEENRPLQKMTRTLVNSPLIAARSFQGVALKVGDEKLGVLYAIYKERQLFGEEERETAESFANHVSLALKKAQVLDRLTKINDAARTVAKVSVDGDKQRALTSIVDEVIRVVGCDAAVLFTYDKTTAKLEHPPTMQGVRDTKLASSYDEVKRDSIVYEILTMREPYFADNVPGNGLFKGKRFANDEGIAACAAVPLRVEGQGGGGGGGSPSEVGVLFINYRRAHRFTDDEKEVIELLSNQTSIAIHNMQLYEERVRRLNEQEALVDLSGEMLRTNNSLETLRRAVAVGAQQLEAEFCFIVLPDPRHDRPVIRASEGFRPRVDGREVTEREAGPELWATLADGEARVVDDYGESEAVPPLVEEYGITSGVCVPIFRGGGEAGEVIGALVVQTRASKPRHFSEAEVAFLRLLANQTAIAYQSAVLFERAKRSSAYLRALYGVSSALSTLLGPGMDVRKVFLPLVQAVRSITGIEGPPAVLATIHTYDPEERVLELQSVYPFEEEQRIVNRFGARRPVDRERAPGGRIGIIGRAVAERDVQLVPDVSEEGDDYLDFHQQTRSELAVPLLDGPRVIGVLNVESDQPDAFNEDDVEAMKALAELAVIGHQSVQTYNASRRGTAVLDALAHIGKTVNNVNPDLKATLKEVLKTVKDKLIDYTAAEVCRGDVKKGVFEVVESHGEQRYTVQAGRVYGAGEGYTSWIAQNQRRLLIPDTAAREEPAPKVKDVSLPIRSFVGVPLCINEREFGTLELVSHLPNAFETWDLYLLEVVRDLVEVAIRNADQAKELRSEAYVAGLGAWGAEVAHYVNTEIGLINLILDRVRARPDLPEGAKEDLGLALNYVSALRFTHENDMSAVAELDHVVGEAVVLVEREWQDLTWRADLNAPGCKVKISKWGLRELTSHLLKNAAKYCPEEKPVREVSVSTRYESGVAYLRVEDTGDGFPKEIEPLVFFQPIRKKGREGTGLMLVRSMVKRHGGWVTLHNSPGQGACIEVCLHVDAGGPGAPGPEAR